MKLIARLRYLLRNRRMESDLADEMAFHREMKEADFISQGLSPAEARSRAAREFGNMTAAHERSREVWIPVWLESVFQDVAYAVRGLRSQPGFSVLAIAALALGIGFNTSLFTVFNAVAIRPWPVRDPGRLAIPYLLFDREMPWGHAMKFSIAEARYMNEHAKTLAGALAYRRVPATIDGAEGRHDIYAVTGNYFRLLGVEMALGRGFIPEEDRVDRAQAVAVLSYALWQSRYASDPRVIGRKLLLDGAPFTIVGVTAPAFRGLNYDPHYVWVPLPALRILRPNDPDIPRLLTSPEYCCSDVVVRLADGYTREQAVAELSVIAAHFADQHRENGNRENIKKVTLTGTSIVSRPDASRTVLPVFGLFFVAVTLILLLACANVGNLLLARAAARQREISVRLAMGAARRRIVRQLLTEGLMLAAIATGLGLLITSALPRFIMQHMVDEKARGINVTVDVTVFAYAAAIALIATLAFALAPALRATRVTIHRSLQEGTATAVRGGMTARGILLATQVGISVILLTSAALLLRASTRAAQRNPGFQVTGIVTAQVDLPATAYSETRGRETLNAVVEHVAKLPGVRGAALCGSAPLGGRIAQTAIAPPHTPANVREGVHVQWITPEYLGVLGIPLLAGRNFTPADASRKILLVNESGAKRYWPSENPVGKLVEVNQDKYEVAGVVRDTYTDSMSEIDPMVYLPFGGDISGTILVRTEGDAAPAIATLRGLIAQTEPRASVVFGTLQGNVDHYLEMSKVGAGVAGALGILALVLASVGIFGVAAYSVEQRTREIGLRMALGARAGEVIRFVLAANSMALVAGLTVGLAGAAAASLLLRSYLYDLSPFDTKAYAAVAGILIAAGTAATAIPVRRATRVDPMTALRCD